MRHEVEIIADSMSPDGIRLTTMHVRYWRAIHAEVMTHRKFGRNARSSRAVPNKVLLREPIFEPLIWGSNRPGMTAGAELTGWRLLLAKTVWRSMALVNRVGVRLLNFAGLHKQWSNRPLEWFGFIDVLITSTDWANFWALRIDSGAQPEMRALAIDMANAMDESSPRALKFGEWHLPYMSEYDRQTLTLEAQQRLSVARCARLSFAPFDGAGDMPAEMARYAKLVESRPVHASPAEHQATPDQLVSGRWGYPILHGNLRGWIQYRKTLADEWVPG